MKALSLFFLLLLRSWVFVDAAAPTKYPSAHPTAVLSKAPTFLPGESGAPSTDPTRKPTSFPSVKPSASPSTATPTNPTSAPTARPSTVNRQLFAIVGGSSCADNLIYGPQPIVEYGAADGRYPYFLSTSTLSRDVPHTDWLQIVTSDGTTELFRIHWTFDTAKTLGQRFGDAVRVGENVNYRVEVANTNQTYLYDATWRFSSTSEITAFTLDMPPGDWCCFSSGGGAWSAASGTIDGNGYGVHATPRTAWGIGSWDRTDADCSTVYSNGVPRTYSTNKVFMYYFAEPPAATTAPTVTPTHYPTSAPTNPTCLPTASPTTPTAAPTIITPSGEPTTRPTTAEPTVVSSVGGEQQLFAVVGGNSCAENLYYGPQYITESGSADGKHPYFLSTHTRSNNVAHTDWLQIVTSDGTNELFRIYWTFRTAETFADRFNNAIIGNVIVDYRIVTSTGETYYKTGTWRFSGTAGLYADRFGVSTTTCCFSYNDGAWGAGSGKIDGDSYVASQFWGIGTFDSEYGDAECGNVYRDGFVDSRVSGSSVKVYMYYFAPIPPSTAPTAAPTPSPSVGGDQQLFAVLGGNTTAGHCASNLYFGPQAITEAGSADGVYPYFFSTATASKNIPHTNWVQIVTSDRGSGSVELFRIYWTFRTAMTLTDRLVYATQSQYGEVVDYRIEVVATNETIYKTGKWQYASYANIYTNKFLLEYTSCCLSGIYGVWGAGINTLDGYGQNNVNNQFWGIGNYYGTDKDCYKVYKNGVVDKSIDNAKVYMYYIAPSPPTTTPTTTPTEILVPTATKAPIREPTGKPTTSLSPSTSPSRKPTAEPTAEPTTLPSTTVPSVAPSTKPISEPSTSPTTISTTIPTATSTPTITPTTKHTTIPTTAPTSDLTTQPSTTPTATPTTILTTSPTSTPTSAPTTVPTMTSPVCTPTPAPTVYPTLQPSTREPSDAPSYTPTTLQPTNVVTAVPSTVDLLEVPSVTPSAVPSIHVSAQPTSTSTTVSTTKNPTILPSGIPTSNPTTSPTLAPTTSPTATPMMAPAVVSLQAQQQVDGVSVDAFVANEAAFNAVFTVTIADAVGVGTDNVKDLSVMVSQSNRNSMGGSSSGDKAPNLRINPSTNTITTTSSSDYLTIQYTIQVPASSGVTYNQLSSQLTNSVQNNQFSSLLQQHAAEQNVTELSSATSGRVETEDTTPADPKTSESSNGTVLTVPVIVGISIGGCAVFVVLIYLFARLWFRRAAGGEEGLPRLDTLQNQASAPPLAADPALSKDINAYFYGDSSHHNNNGGSSPTGGNNQIVPHDHQEHNNNNNHDTEAPLGSGGGSSDASGDGSGGMNVSSHMSAHRPHAAHNGGTSGVSTGDIELPMRSPGHATTNNTSSTITNNSCVV